MLITIQDLLIGWASWSREAVVLTSWVSPRVWSIVRTVPEEEED